MEEESDLAREIEEQIAALSHASELASIVQRCSASAPAAMTRLLLQLKSLQEENAALIAENGFIKSLNSELQTGFGNMQTHCEALSRANDALQSQVDSLNNRLIAAGTRSAADTMLAEIRRSSSSNVLPASPPSDSVNAQSPSLPGRETVYEFQDAVQRAIEACRPRLACASPNCTLRSHRNLEVYGGFCCIACSEGHGEHGPRCEQLLADRDAVRASPSRYPQEPEQYEVEEAVEEPGLEVEQESPRDDGPN
mmetsp:Transcript_31365/g.50355  ORF Transcript_31365/g.50355 Transcript_31365/m.50355 type:complete len:253 (+) Transcript_31365:84-842(+)